MSTILAVDDSATMRKCLEITFSGTEFELVTCGTADEALEKVKTLSPALVIADVSLPPSDGYQLCTTIKLAAPDLPVLMLSSKQNPFDSAKGSQADAHIDKPFDTQVLQDRVRELAETSGRKADTDIPGSPDRPSQSRPVSMPDRQQGSSKIPAPRRKRPTPAMMAKPQLAEEPQVQQASREQKSTASASMRRTVPFAMPGGNKRNPQQVVDAMRRAGQGASRRSERKSADDTLPGVKENKAVETRPISSDSPQAESAELRRKDTQEQPAAPGPAVDAGAAGAGAGAGSAGAGGAGGAGSAGAGGPSVALSADRTAPLAKRLEDLGLSKDQMEGVLALSRDLVEQVVWEVVPVLAETLIKEEIARLTKDG